MAQSLQANLGHGTQLSIIVNSVTSKLDRGSFFISTASCLEAPHPFTLQGVLDQKNVNDEQCTIFFTTWLFSGGPNRIDGWEKLPTR
jgi:hypothetical protein